MKVPIAKIGDLQKLDIEKSAGVVLYDDIARICTVIKPNNENDRGDKTPHRIAKLFGGSWKDYNYYFIVQAAGCPLKCPFCYVDNMKTDLFMTADELVERFIEFKKKAKEKFGIDLRILRFMGGAPAIYCEFWPKLREALDKRGYKDIILYSDVIFVENYFYKVEPWKYLDKIPNFVITGCLKGTNKQNFIENSGGFDLFEQAIKELKNYVKHENFFLDLIGYDESTLDNVYEVIPKERIDFLKIINYEATKLNLQKAISTHGATKYET